MDQRTAQAAGDSGAFYRRIIAELEQGQSAAGLSHLVSEVDALAVGAEEKKALLASLNQSIDLARRIEQYRLNERALRAVSESAKSLTELKDLDAVLNGIVMRGRELLGSDLAWLAMQQDDVVRLVAIDGGHTEYIKHMGVRGNAGIAGYVSHSKSTFTTQDYLNDPHFNHDAEVDRAIRAEGLVSVVAAPILSGEQVIGILIVADRYKRVHQPWEVSILVALSAHASVAIGNARFFQQKQRAIQDTEGANRDLKDSSQQQMVALVTELLDGPAAFLDPSGQVLRATARAQDATPFARPISAPVLTAVEDSRYRGKSVRVEQQAADPLYVMAVSSGDDHIGSLLVATRETLSEDRIRIFEHCSAAIAVLALLDEKKAASSLRDIQETVEALLEASELESGSAQAGALKLGLDVSRPLVCLLITVDKSKLHYVTKRLMAGLRPFKKLAAQVDDGIVLLVDSDDPERVRKALEKLIFRDLGLPALICLSPAIDDVTALPGHYHQSRQAMRVARKLGRHTGSIQEQAYYLYDTVFAHRDAADIQRFLDATIGALIDHDAERNASLCTTLRVFLDLHQNARATAKALNVHVNTVHNRLETIGERIGDWQNSNRSLELHLALRLQALRAAP
jgi:hypothetical protein